MKTSPDDMYAELKRHVIPALREIGFKGSMPYPHRIDEDNHIDLLTIQLASGGGSFVVEIGFADPERKNVYFRKETSAAKLRISQTTTLRRPGAADDCSDFWLAYDGERPFGMTGDPSMLAETVGRLVYSQAIPWWNSRRMNGR